MAKFQIIPSCLGVSASPIAAMYWNTDPTLRKLFHDFDAVIFTPIVAGFAWFVCCAAARLEKDHWTLSFLPRDAAHLI